MTGVSLDLELRYRMLIAVNLLSYVVPAARRLRIAVDALRQHG